MSGLEHLTTETVALPIHSWAMDLTLEEDRPLPRLEETILRLAQAGVREFQRFAQLLGVEERHLARAFGDLRLKAALSAQGGAYEVTAEGLKLLERAALRTLRKVPVRLWHDPYTDTLSWADFENDELMTGIEQRESGLRALHAPVELREDELRERHREIQALIQQNGLPEDEDDLEQRPMRHLVNVTPKGHSTVFLPVELDVLRHAGTGQLAYVLKRNGKADREASLALGDLAERNIDLVPFEPLRTLPPEAQRLVDRIITLQRKGPVIQLDDPRISPLLRRAVPASQHFITLVSPFQSGSRVGTELLRTLRTRLLHTPDLRAQVIVTGTAEGAEMQSEARKLLEQMQAVESIRARLQILEVLEVQAEGVVVDHAWALMASRQFARHPWKTEYGLPYHRLHFINDQGALNAFQTDVHTLSSARSHSDAALNRTT